MCSCLKPLPVGDMTHEYVEWRNPLPRKSVSASLSSRCLTSSAESVFTVSSPGRNLKEWLQEQFCDKPLEQDDMRLHNAAYVGDLDTLRNLLQEEDFKR